MKQVRCHASSLVFQEDTWEGIYEHKRAHFCVESVCFSQKKKKMFIALRLSSQKQMFPDILGIGFNIAQPPRLDKYVRSGLVTLHSGLSNTVVTGEIQKRVSRVCILGQPPTLMPYVSSVALENTSYLSQSGFLLL